MTKYDYIFKSKEKIAASLNPEEAVVAIAVITTAVDVGLEDINGEIIADILWEFEIFDEYSEEQMLETVDTLIELAEDAGLGSLFNAANAAISEEVVLDGFAAGVIMLLDAEDLIIPADKKTYLKQLQIALELEDEEAKEIIEEVIAAVQEGDDGEYLDEEFESIIFNESGEQFYQSPLGNFTVPIPLDSEQGGKIQTDEGMVSFSDDMGTLLRIDYYPLSLEEIKEIKTQGYEAYLHEVIINEYVPQTIISNVPNAEVRHREYWQEPLKRYDSVVLNLPGATISQQETNGHGIKLDTYRGLLSFVNSECLYIVSSQRSLLNGETLGSVKEEAEKMKQTILNFVKTIEFVEI
ncbi:MAG: tellurite resistance TerB family protein [Dolichospermum sp.]